MHHWSRELQALGHTVRFMAPAYVKPDVKRQKNDATDAEAICEAVTRPNMRFSPPRADHPWIIERLIRESYRARQNRQSAKVVLG